MSSGPGCWRLAAVFRTWRVFESRLANHHIALLDITLIFWYFEEDKYYIAPETPETVSQLTFI